MRTWSVTPLGPDLGQHEAAWDALNRDRFGNHPLLSSLFVNGLLREFGGGDEHLCILREGQVILAMVVLRRRNRFLWSSFIPHQCQVGPTLVPEVSMLDSLVASLPGTVLQLDLLCQDPDLGQVLHDARPSAHRAVHAYTMSIPLTGTFAEYWAARPRSLPSNMRRYERRLERDGIEARLVKVTGVEDVVAAVERYARLEGAGWKGRHGTALGSTPEQYRFYETLLGTAAMQGKAVAYELWLGDRLAAARLALVDGGMLVMLKTSYNEEMAAYAPGRLLMRAAIEDAFTSWPGGVIEFYTDASIDQLEWAGAARWIEHLTLFRHGAAEFALMAAKACRVPRRSRHDEEHGGTSSSTVEVFAHPDALPADARQFLQEAEARNLAFGFDWYRNLVDTVYRDHPGLRLYVLRRGGKVAAILPIRVTRGRFGWRAHSLTNFYTSLFEPALAPNIKPDDLLPLLAAVRGEYRKLGALMLRPMMPGSHAYLVLLEALRLDRWAPFGFFAFGNWYQRINTAWPDYLAARAGSVRSTIKRAGRKFEAAGGTMELLTRPEDLPVAIAAYEKVYSSSWKKPEPYPDFMPGLLRTTAGKGMLRFGLARIDGQPVAVQAWIVGHGRAEIYKLAYDEQFKAFAPGTLLTAMLMEHVIEVDGVSEVDYLIGDDPYKETWMSERRERWGIVAYNLRTPTGLAGLAREILGRTVKRLRAWARQRPRPRPSTVVEPVQDNEVNTFGQI